MAKAKEGSAKEESAEKKKLGKGFDAFEKKEDAGKPKKFAKGGLATTQANLKSMGRGMAKIANQKSVGKMKGGGSVRGK